jgi:hypothetical protein
MDILYSIGSCIVIVIISICLLVLIGNLLGAGISILLLSNLKSRINNILTSSFKTPIAFYLVYGSEGVSAR